MSEKAERLDIRLSDEEKKRLAELADQKGVSMADLVRTWIMRGDVAHVLAEQLQDIVNDFAKWHVLENRRTSVQFLCTDLRSRMAITDATRSRMMYRWLDLFHQSFQFMRSNVSNLSTRLSRFISQKEPKEKKVLVRLISEFAQIITSYHDIFVRGFMDILQDVDDKTKKDISGVYNDEFRTRFNEITSKYEDFLKRAQRELGEELKQAMPRAKEFRPSE